MLGRVRRRLRRRPSTTVQIAHALATPVGPAGWAGAYLELLSYGCFLVFAVWACAKLGGAVLGAAARAAAVTYPAVGIAALSVMNALAHRAGHGIGGELGMALATVSSSSSPAGS